MKTNEELYLEEQQQILLDTQKAIGELLPALEKVASAIEPPKDEVAIKGNVTIANQPEAIAVTNLEAITDALNNLGDKLHTSIEKNAHKPPEAVTVKNQVDSVTVKNLTSTNKLLTELKKAIDGLDLNVTVEKQDIKFPTAAKDALPVRLSDGKSFYKAVQTAVTTGLSNSVLQGVDSTGKPRPIRVAAIDGNEANGFGVVVVDASGDPISSGGGVIEKNIVAANMAVATDLTEPSLNVGLAIDADDMAVASDITEPAITQTHAIDSASMAVASDITEPTVTADDTDNLLLESGDALLLETGDQLLLE